MIQTTPPRRRRRRIARRDDTAEGAIIRREMRFPQASPERVWRALTEAAQLAKWLLPVEDGKDIIPAAGHSFAFVTPHEGRLVKCQVLEAEPGRRLAYTWQAAPDQPATVVTWTVERDTTRNGGTRLVLEHSMGGGDAAFSPALLLTGFTNHGTARLRACLRGDDAFSSSLLSRRRRTARQQSHFSRTGVPLCL